MGGRGRERKTERKKEERGEITLQSFFVVLASEDESISYLFYCVMRISNRLEVSALKWIQRVYSASGHMWTLNQASSGTK